MQYARFERVQPREWQHIPFACDDDENLPSLAESILWVLLGSMFIALCVGLLGA